MQEVYHISQRRAYRLIGISRNSARYIAKDKIEDEQITQRIIAHETRWKRFGYRRIHVLLQRENIFINHKKTYRLYKQAGLSIKQRNKKKKYEKRGVPKRTVL